MRMKELEQLYAVFDQISAYINYEYKDGSSENFTNAVIKYIRDRENEIKGLKGTLQDRDKKIKQLQFRLAISGKNEQNSDEQTFTDPRDGHTYKTVKIGNQIWMAENLAYSGVDHSYPKTRKINPPEYGYLYNWKDAQEACPPGWHLPTKVEFEELLTYADNNKSSRSSRFLSLIANSMAWKASANMSMSLDEFGFSALPAGCHDQYYDNDGFFWSSTEDNDDSPCASYLYLGNCTADIYSSFKKNTLSVRCIKD